MPPITSIAPPVAHLVGPGKLRVLSGRLAFSSPGQSPLRLDPRALRSVFCYGKVTITDEALRILLSRQIEVALMTASGFRCHGRLVGNRDSATLLRARQHRVLAEPRFCLELARRAVLGKIQSQQDAARHYQRQGIAAAGPMRHRLKDLSRSAQQTASLEQLRGFEGMASAVWFDLFGQLLSAPWTFPGRRRRPPPDPVNALLSLAYTWLLQRVIARLQARGLETNLGALHEFRPGRPSLGCDLVEPLRVPAVDRWVVAWCNTGKLAVSDFHQTQGGVRLAPGRFGRLLAGWEQHWSEAALEKQLERSIDELCQSIRRWSEELPNPLKWSENGEPSGSFPSDDSRVS